MSEKALEIAAHLMALSATTAPKSRGESFVFTKIIEGRQVKEIADSMEQFGEKTKKKNFDRDAKSVRNSEVILLIGIRDATPISQNCGACGYDNCTLLEKRTGPEFSGPHCAFRLLDMGIAIGSAVKTASILNVDNRIMYRIGAVARSVGIVDWDFVMGIPLSGTGKNIHFDR
ncbi:MAG: hypothetical protein JW765_12180 [Deltaproteobacteria bacterium]|nr:hypothetical protein [Candidatus Zymogenaceae bacterium]